MWVTRITVGHSTNAPREDKEQIVNTRGGRRVAKFDII